MIEVMNIPVTQICPSPRNPRKTSVSYTHLTLPTNSLV